MRTIRCQTTGEVVNSYKLYLRTKHWEQIKQRKLSQKNYKCEICGAKRNLNIHHKTYERLGCEELTDLQVLCKRCHELIHIHMEFGEDIKTFKRGRYSKRPKPKLTPKQIEMEMRKKKKYRKYFKELDKIKAKAQRELEAINNL